MDPALRTRLVHAVAAAIYERRYRNAPFNSKWEQAPERQQKEYLVMAAEAVDVVVAALGAGDARADLCYDAGRKLLGALDGGSESEREDAFAEALAVFGDPRAEADIGLQAQVHFAYARRDALAEELARDAEPEEDLPPLDELLTDDEGSPPF